MHLKIEEFRLPLEYVGQRLDQALADLYPDISRSRMQSWIKQGHVTVDGEPVVPKIKVKGGEAVKIVPQADEVCVTMTPEAISLNIVFEDDEMLIINKPAGLVVHPGAGNPDGTLQNALLHHAPQTVDVPRAGIVHRIDKQTTGLLVVAKTLRAHVSLVDQLSERAFQREYDAVVYGRIISGAMIEAPIGRHPRDRKKMSVQEGGREAITHYRVKQRFRHHTHVTAKLETGRTHQIRVHMAHIHHPLVGDPVYGGRLKTPAGATPELLEVLHSFHRQALHAATLGVVHPVSGESMVFHAEPPADFLELVRVLAEDTKHHESDSG